MAMVSIDIEAMIEYVAALESARADSVWAAGSLQSLCVQAGEWDADCASFNGGESTAELDALIMDARRRLALAQLIAASVPGGLPVADFDDSYMSTLSREEVGEVVDRVMSLVGNDRGEITQELVDLVAQNSIDPYFAQELANRLSPQRLADCLSQINHHRLHDMETEEQALSFDAVHNALLYALAGSYSLAAHGTGDVAVPGFTTTWQDAFKGMENNPYGIERVLLLSFVIERGQWPDDFLEGVYGTIRDLEGADGLKRWEVGPIFEPINPWPPDPDTGWSPIANDPMGGILAAMANNPDLVGKLFTGGPPATIDIGNGTQTGVDSRLWWMLHDRGATEYTINALAQALSAALSVPPVEGGEAWQPTLATDLDKITQAFEEEGRVADEEFKRSIPHMILDVLGFIPAVGAGPDLVNTVWYAVERDWANAGVSLAAAIPFVGYIAVGGKWVKKTLSAADLVKITDSSSFRKIYAAAKAGTATPTDVLKLTDPDAFKIENMLSKHALNRFSGKLEHMRGMVAGNMFNIFCSVKYGKFTEISVLKTPAGGYYRVDAIMPDKWVVSRKFTQFSDIQIKTGIGYLDEFDTKYLSGVPLPNTPKNAALGIVGTRVPNIRILEVPPQANPIPREILENAVSRIPPIIIVSSAGVEYTAAIRAELGIIVNWP